MEPRSPWRELPNRWLDSQLSNHRGYRAFQEYFGVKVKPELINEYLLGEGICPGAEIEVEQFSAEAMPGALAAEGSMRITGPLKQGGVGTDTIKIKRSLNWNDRECHFDLIGTCKVSITGFGVEYYRRVIPLLRKLGFEKITAMPTTGPEYSPEKNRLVGAYVWSFYGYSNDNMAETLKQYINYLGKVRGIKLSHIEEDRIRSIPRMKNLAEHEQPNNEKTGKKSLLGLDAQDKPTRTVGWHGTHHNINDESPQNEEMMELINYLLKKMK